MMTNNDTVLEENYLGLNTAQMVQDFVRRATLDNEMARICSRALDAESLGGVCIPLNEQERAALDGCPLVSTAPASHGLFILDSNRLYTRRNWCYEQLVVNRINAMISRPVSMAEASIQVPQDGAFENLNDLQRQAIQRMLRHPFTILTGGPGTGKTYTIARAVKLIKNVSPEYRLGLTAPTGKAKARVREAMVKEAEILGLEDIPETTTLHTLLEPNHDLVTFKHNHCNPLQLDWLIVDEASMISLPMMAKLLDALPPECRLTLVGDACQLASVEPGQIFGDLCNMPLVNDQACKCELRESRRFPVGGEIATLADCIRTGDGLGALNFLNIPRKLVHYRHLNTRDNEDNGLKMQDTLNQIVEKLWARYADQTTPEGALGELNQCKILCALRKGNFGCDRMNAWVLNKLQKQNRNCAIPMMITRNDRNLGVSNGDVGVLFPSQSETLFLPDGNTIRQIPLALLPAREMAFASTVHKAQGSEYENVIIILPPLNDPEKATNTKSLLTRELLYTAITRTKEQLFIFAENDAIQHCCENETLRYSGLSCLK